MCNTNATIDALTLVAACHAWLKANPEPAEMTDAERMRFPYRTMWNVTNLAALAGAARDSGMMGIRVTADDFWPVAKFWDMARKGLTSQ